MNVSRETRERLDLYLTLLKRWNPKINLVAPASLENASERHFADSLQVAEHCPPDTNSWADLGSGGGFPGAVVAIAQAGHRKNLAVTLVESDQRKAAFLRTVSRETGVGFKVISERIEDVPPLGADVISARALASLDRLLGYAERHMSLTGIALFQKGEQWKEELEIAQKKWRFSWEAHTSVTNPNAVILEIGDLSRA